LPPRRPATHKATCSGAEGGNKKIWGPEEEVEPVKKNESCKPSFKETAAGEKRERETGKNNGKA